MFLIIRIVVIIFLLLQVQYADVKAFTANDLSKLQQGKVITKSLTSGLAGSLKGAEAKVVINSSAEKVWNVLTNQENLPVIVSRLKKVDVIEKKENFQKVQASLKVCPLLPLFKYTLFIDQKEKYKRLKYKKIDGCFKELYGSWELEPKGEKTILTYKMYIDTGFYVPAFISDAGLNKDLPEIMMAIKNCVENQ